MRIKNTQYFIDLYLEDRKDRPFVWTNHTKEFRFSKVEQFSWDKNITVMWLNFSQILGLDTVSPSVSISNALHFVFCIQILKAILFLDH